MKAIRRLLRRGRDFLISPLQSGGASTVQCYDTVAQLQLAITYRAMAKAGTGLARLGDAGFKAFSQSDEDCILLYISSMIGTEARKCVELCAGDGIECNTANLIINHGWSGLLVDGRSELIQRGREFYRTNSRTYVCPPTLVNAWITRANVNSLLRENGFEGEVDLLSLDMDGMDYWIWKSIEAIDARVVVREFQDILGPEHSVSVPYAEKFNARDYPMTDGRPNYCGASLGAFSKLAAAKGYRLVGCNRYCYNAFFIRNPLGEDLIPEVPVRSCFNHPRIAQETDERYSTIQDLPWVEV